MKLQACPFCKQPASFDYTFGGSYCYVECGTDGCMFFGPSVSTKRAAGIAWNSIVLRKEERRATRKTTTKR